MPPKRQNVQLKKARESKAQNKIKNEQDFNVFDDDSLNFDINSDDNDSETIIDSEDEYVLSSDDELNNEIWYDETFESNFNLALPSILDKIMVASSSISSSSSTSNRPSVYIGNAPRTMRRKNAAFETAAANTNPLISFFPKSDSLIEIDNNDQMVEHELDSLEYPDIESNEMDSIKKFKVALSKLSDLEKDKDIDSGVKARIQTMCQFLRLRINGYGAYNASQIIAESIGAKPWRAHLIRTWSNQFLKDSTLPISRRGKHQKIKSLLYDEDLHELLVEYLWSKKCNVNVKDFKKYIEEEVFPSIGIEENKEISETTVRVWLKKLGWSYQKVHKDIYIDGHERPDVVLAREKFLDELSAFENLMPTPSEDDIMILNEPILAPEKKKHILVVHDESIFYANDGKKTYWGPKDNVPLRKKGMGLSLHVSDFLTEARGRLKFGEDEACVIMKPGVSRDGWWTSKNLIEQVFFLIINTDVDKRNLSFLINYVFTD
jgi:hypothetical protein